MEKEALVDPNARIQRKGLQEYIDGVGGKIDRRELLEWARGVLKEKRRVRAVREETRRDTEIIGYRLVEKAKFKTQGWVRSRPALTKDGDIVVGSGDGYVYVLNPDATLVARFKTQGWVRSRPALTKDGDIVVGSGDGYVYVLNPDATEKVKI